MFDLAGKNQNFVEFYTICQADAMTIYLYTISTELELHIIIEHKWNIH